ncbi:hypothetical protein ACR6C2_21840 [Streptomyces sp. INA 01156]
MPFEAGSWTVFIGELKAYRI